jgi:hypothetical protein
MSAVVGSSSDMRSMPRSSPIGPKARATRTFSPAELVGFSSRISCRTPLEKRCSITAIGCGPPGGVLMKAFSTETLLASVARRGPRGL